MNDFFKVFLRGVIITLLSPLIVAFLALYGVYLLFVFVVMFLKSTIIFFMGGDPNKNKQDKEAAKLLEYREQTTADATKVMSDIMHQAIIQNPEAIKAMAQQQIVSNQAQANQQSVPEITPRIVEDLDEKPIFGEDEND